MGQAVIYNPYVSQIEKIAESLQHMSERFAPISEHENQLTQESLEEIFQEVQEKVCVSCDRCTTCHDQREVLIRKMTYEILTTVERYGIELSVEMKRRLFRECVRAPRFLRETLEVFAQAKIQMAWKNRMKDSRNRYHSQMELFADMLKDTTKELDAGIFADPRLEQRIVKACQNNGVRLLDCVLYMTKTARYEIHLTAKIKKGECLTVKDLAQILSEAMDAKMVPKAGERPVMSSEYATVTFVEQPDFYTLQGVAKIGKGGAQVSGDSFLLKGFPSGKQAAILSDGMGAGEDAGRESSKVLEMLEELLDAGYPMENAVRMLNTALFTGKDDISFSTLDIAMMDLYEGKCQWMKAGAAPSFVKRKNQLLKISQSCVPLGVLEDIPLKPSEFKLQDGDYLILLTDGVLDVLPPMEQEQLLTTIIAGTSLINPKEFSDYILNQVLAFYGKEPLDDMLVIVVGVWKRT